MVRDPLELVASFHAHLVFTRNEDQPRLAAAWKLRSRRREGLRIPAECRDAKVLQYDQIARLGEQTERWLHLFGEEQVKVIYFDDFVADTARVYREVLEFLGLPDDHRSSFPVVNARRRQRLDAVANFTERTPEALVRIAMAAKRLLGLEAWGVLDALRRWNSAPSNPETIDTQTEREITEAYRSDVSRLATLTGRDCESWFDRPRTDRGLRGELRKSCAVAPPT